jgi:hypothetical protein
LDWPGSAVPAAARVGRTGDALRAVGPALPPGLIDAAAWRRLLAAADEVPLTTGGGIECRLDDPGRADLAVRFRSDVAAEWAQMDAAAGLSGLGGLLHGRSLRLLWLERDVVEDAAAVPSVFAGPGNPPFGAPADPPDEAEWCAIVAQLWAGTGYAALQRLAAALPDGAWVAYLGLLRGRERRAVVAGLAPAEIIPLLDRLGWPGGRAALAPVLECARRHTARIALGVDLTDGIGAGHRTGAVRAGLLGDPAGGPGAERAGGIAWRIGGLAGRNGGCAGLAGDASRACQRHRPAAEPRETDAACRSPGPSQDLPVLRPAPLIRRRYVIVGSSR